MAIADTSFIFALYGQDAHTAAARAHVSQRRLPIATTLLQRYEFSNAVRFAGFRRILSADEVLAMLTAFEADLQSGYLITHACDFDAVLKEAQRISAHHTLKAGHRSFDILHVATARVLRMKEFFTFDANQRKLAEAIGLTVGP